LIRKALFSLTPGTPEMEALWTGMVDAGNVVCTGNLEADQEDLAEVVASHLSDGIVCIVLGGGHETAFGHYLGYVKSSRTPAILNVDAHADVRELVVEGGHSGSPFRQALELGERAPERYTVFGLQPQSVSRRHVEYLDENPTSRIWRSESTVDKFDEILADGSSELMVTFDLDAVDEAFAPGVSAPCANGLQVEDWLKMSRASGVASHVTSMDVCEFNPLHDIEGRTARLAALTVWTFVSGLAARIQASAIDSDGE